MRLRISISVWHPWLSTLRTMHGYLYEAGSTFLVCVPLKAVNTMLAKTTKVVITTNKLNFSTFIPFTPFRCALESPMPWYCVLSESLFDLTKAVRIPKLQKTSNIPKKLSLTGFRLIWSGWQNDHIWPNDKWPFGQRARHRNPPYQGVLPSPWGEISSSWGPGSMEFTRRRKGRC